MTVMLDQPPELLWGSFALCTVVDPDVPWQCTTLATTEFGNAVPILEFIESSLIVDGGEAVVTGWERRTFTVAIRITAPDGQAMAQAQNALFDLVRADEKPALLWTPPMVGAWTGAFDVVAVRFVRKYDVGGGWDYREKHTRQRVFELEFTTKTWVRDPEPIEVPALPVPENPDDPPADVSVDECTTTTGWTRQANPYSSEWEYSLAVSGGGIRTTATVTSDLVLPSSFQEIGMGRAAPFSTLGLPYLLVDAATGWWVSMRDAAILPAGSITAPAQSAAVAGMHARVVADGTAWDLSPTTVLPTADPAVWRYVFELPGTSITSLQVVHHFEEDQLTGLLDAELRRRQRQYWIRTDRVSLTDRIAVSGSSGFQVARTITIEGSAPTGAAITFDAGPDPLLGSTALIYTGPSEVISLRGLDDGIPPGFTADTTMMSGAWNTLNGDTVSLVPVARLSDSKYDLLGRLNFTGTARVYWSARLVGADGSDIPGSDVVRTGDILLRNGTADPWKIHTIATIAMPVIKVEGISTHNVEVKVWMVSGGAAVKVDERWLADRRGAVTLVHEPSAFQLSKIELRSPQLGAPRYQVIGTWVGYGSQDIARLSRVGRHRFAPGLLHVFTATDLAPFAEASLRYHRTYPNEPGPALPIPAGV